MQTIIIETNLMQKLHHIDFNQHHQRNKEQVHQTLKHLYWIKTRRQFKLKNNIDFTLKKMKGAKSETLLHKIMQTNKYPQLLKF